MSGAKSGVTHVSELALAPELYPLKKGIYQLPFVLLLPFFLIAFTSSKKSTTQVNVFQAEWLFNE